MKKFILLGMTLLSASAAHADVETCKFQVWFIRSGQVDAEVTQGKFYQISKEQCSQEAKEPIGSEHITRMTAPGALIVKTKFKFVDHSGDVEEGIYYHSFWKR